MSCALLPASLAALACRPLAPGKYKLTAMHPSFQPKSAQVTIPEDGSGAQQDFTLTALPGTAASDWEEGISMSTAHPVLKHVVLRSPHVTVLALMGLVVCSVGGWVLMRTTHGRMPALGQMLRGRREYEMVSTANGALRV